MRILLFGGTGQVGSELRRTLAPVGTITAPTREEIDLAQPETARDAVRAIRPDVIVNAAAYTLVDRAELEPEACAQLNAELPALLAEECARIGALLVHFSTDYVFDGAKRAPYTETDAPHPLGVYGRTKLEGERRIVAAQCASLVFRTSWIYATHGRNFPLTIMRLARERDALAVVSDQTGAPTAAPAVATGVADVLRQLAASADFRDACSAATGIYHMTASGEATWYDFARQILADDPNRAEHRCRTIRPIPTIEYPTPAPRPAYSVLDNGKLADRFGVRLPSWEAQWRAVAEELRAAAR